MCACVLLCCLGRLIMLFLPPFRAKRLRGKALLGSARSGKPSNSQHALCVRPVHMRLTSVQRNVPVIAGTARPAWGASTNSKPNNTTTTTAATTTTNNNDNHNHNNDNHDSNANTNNTNTTNHK